MLHYEAMTKIIDDKFGKEKRITGIEIGTNTGMMERALLSAFPYLFMYGIDEVDHKLDTWNEPRIKFIHSTSDDAVKLFEKDQFDFIYVDACHTYEQAKKDIVNYSRFVKQDGIIAGHDYVIDPGNMNECVRFAVDELFESDKIHFDEDLVWWVYKKDVKWL